MHTSFTRCTHFIYAVPVFRDLTRNRESFRERSMEHDTFVTNLPRVRAILAVHMCVLWRGGGIDCVVWCVVRAHVCVQIHHHRHVAFLLDCVWCVVRARVRVSKCITTNTPPFPRSKALQQYEEEQELARKQGYARNPLVRDQATLIIDKVEKNG